MNKERVIAHIMYKMFTLIADRPLFLRIKKGMTVRAAEELFSCPVSFSCEGQIVPLTKFPCNVYIAEVGDDFSSVASAVGCDKGALRELNGGIIYPTRKIFWLSKSAENS